VAGTTWREVGAGFLIVDHNDLDELNAFLQLCVGLMSFDVRAIKQRDYASEVEKLRAVVGQGGDKPIARMDFA